MPENFILKKTYSEKSINTSSATNLKKMRGFSLDRSRIPENVNSILDNLTKDNPEFEDVAETIKRQLDSPVIDYSREDRIIEKTIYGYKHDSCFYLSCMNLNKSDKVSGSTNLLVISLEDYLDIILSMSFIGVRAENIRKNLGDNYHRISRMIMNLDIENIQNNLKLGDIFHLDPELDSIIRARYSVNRDSLDTFSFILEKVVKNSFKLLTFLYQEFSIDVREKLPEFEFCLTSRTNNKILFETNYPANSKIVIDLDLNMIGVDNSINIDCNVYESYQYINNVNSVLSEVGVLKCW